MEYRRQQVAVYLLPSWVQHIRVRLASAKLGAANRYVHNGLCLINISNFNFYGPPLARITRKTNTEGTSVHISAAKLGAAYTFVLSNTFSIYSH